MGRRMKNKQFAYAKTKPQISFAVTVKLISAIVFATQIVQFVFFLNPKFQEASLLLCCTDQFVSDLVGTPYCWFSHAKAQMFYGNFKWLRLMYHKLRIIDEYYFSLFMRKPTTWVPTRSDTNRAVQSQKLVRGWKFWIKKVEELY